MTARATPSIPTPRCRVSGAPHVRSSAKDVASILNARRPRPSRPSVSSGSPDLPGLDLPGLRPCSRRFHGRARPSRSSSLRATPPRRAGGVLPPRPARRGATRGIRFAVYESSTSRDRRRRTPRPRSAERADVSDPPPSNRTPPYRARGRFAALGRVGGCVHVLALPLPLRRLSSRVPPLPASPGTSPRTRAA